MCDFFFLLCEQLLPSSNGTKETTIFLTENSNFVAFALFLQVISPFPPICLIFHVLDTVCNFAFCGFRRLPAVSECGAGGPVQIQAARPSSSGGGPAPGGGSSPPQQGAQPSGMAVSRVPSPPPPEVNTPVAENWCYTQVSDPPTSRRYLFSDTQFPSQRNRKLVETILW